MTALDPGASAAAAREGSGGAAPSVAAADVPVPADGVVALGAAQGSGYRRPPTLVRRGDGQVLQVTPLLYAVMAAIDGRRSYDEVAAEAGRVAGRTLHADDVRTLIDQKLRPLGLVNGPDGVPASVQKANPLLALRPRVVVSRPEVTRRVTAPFAVLFTPLLVIAVTVAFVGVAYWVLWHKGLASAAHDAFASPGLLLLVFVVTVFSAGFHEFGHAAALRRGGGTPGAMGMGLYLAFPAFYTEVTDAYRLDRRARLRTDLGGLYFNAIVALFTFGLWLYSGWDALLLIIATQILQMVRQLPPLPRFDGYHVVADLTGVPDLFHHIGPTLRSFVPFGHRRQQPLKLWVRVVVTAWVVLVVPVMLCTALLAIVSLPRLIASAGRSIADHSAAVVTDGKHGQILAALANVLGVIAVAVPVVGILYLLVRTVRRSAVRTWQRTEGRPVKRAVAGLVAAALVAGLCYAWWPRGNYRAIKASERGTVQDAVPAAWRSALGVSPSADAGLRDGQLASARTVWPEDAGPVPTAAAKQLAVVISPKSGDGPTWVFPFNRPAPPGPGDNQSMAIVTKDGASVYDVAVALVWATGDTVLNKNEAYAFASCTRCKAVAVSFQVVLVVGSGTVAAPQNISAAVNYNCIKCVTEALAVQLVLTLPTKPSGDVLAQLMALWREIARFGTHIKGLTLAQIKARIEDYERRIVAVLGPLVTSSSSSASVAVSSTAATTSVAPSSSSVAPSSSTSPVESSSSVLPSSSSVAPSTTAVSSPTAPAPTP
jgi:putative peptide zinc metalloprotease protein